LVYVYQLDEYNIARALCLVAAGVVQKGIRSRAIHIEDVYKTFQDVFKDLWTTKYNIRI